MNSKTLINLLEYSNAIGKVKMDNFLEALAQNTVVDFANQREKKIFFCLFCI